MPYYDLTNCKSKLGRSLHNFRIDRPDEWTMDEFAREAEKMHDERDQLINRVADLNLALADLKSELSQERDRVKDLTDAWHDLVGGTTEPDPFGHVLIAEVDYNAFHSLISALSAGEGGENAD